jgi:hypothetical protein
MFKGFVVIKHKYEHHVSLQTVSLAASKLWDRAFCAKAFREGRREWDMPWCIYTGTCYIGSRSRCWNTGRLPCSCWQTQHYNIIWGGYWGLYIASIVCKWPNRVMNFW